MCVDVVRGKCGEMNVFCYVEMCLGLLIYGKENSGSSSLKVCKTGMVDCEAVGIYIYTSGYYLSHSGIRRFSF